MRGRLQLSRHAIKVLRASRACSTNICANGTARYANVGVERMMRELTRRASERSPPVEQFADGLETLADLFER